MSLFSYFQRKVAEREPEEENGRGGEGTPKKTENWYRQRKKNFLNYWKAMFIMRKYLGEIMLALISYDKNPSNGR